MNAFVLQTFPYGMENIVLHVQLEPNLIQNKDNVIIAQKDLSEIITVMPVFQDYEKMINLSVYLLIIGRESILNIK
jgi:hypothetical protein